MEPFDWLEAIKTNLSVLRSVGIWPKDDFYKFDWYTVYATAMAVIVIFGHNLFQTINIFFVYTDLEALTRIIFVATTNFLATLKMYFFVRNMKKIKKLISGINRAQFQPKSLKQVDLVMPILKNYKFIYKCYMCIVVFIVSSWSINPIMDQTYQNYQLPFDSWYPFNTKTSPNYEITYAYQMICIWPMSACNVNLDALICEVMMYIRIQCDLLCDNLSNLDDDENFHNLFIECIKHHKAIIRFAEDTNTFFSVIALGQMATAVAVLAMTMFQLTLVGPLSSEGMSHLLYIFGISFQILLYCLFGNNVELQSANINSAIYQAKWFKQTQSTKRNILIFFIRGQRPIRMTAINLFNLSLETYVKILRTAYSYFALLSNVSKE